MAKFSDAKCSGAMDPKLQASHNHLIDLLNTGQVFEMTVNGHAIRIVLNREGFTGTIDGVSMFGLDPVTGKFAIGTYEDLIASLGALALLDVVETGQLGSTIFNGTHILEALIEKDIYVQDAAPAVVRPSMWLETLAGMPKSLWLVTSNYSVDVLAVAGGGSGGGGARGGAGGAGGFIYEETHIVTNTPYAIVVGLGGILGHVYTDTSSADVRGASGNNSSFDGLIAIGGGGGGGGDNTPSAYNGGSGGGSWGGGTAGSPTSGQGYLGGVGSGVSPYRTGGGGGAGGVGGAGTDGGNGGAGASNSISGTSVEYACGGSGASYGSAAHGTHTNGGGGNNSNPCKQAGTKGFDGTGSGGGSGGDGGDGIVIVRYLTAVLGPCTGGIKTTSGIYTVHTFTSSGTFTVVAP